MVAVIAGSGLGLWGTSLSQLGLGLGGKPGLGQGGATQYVNVATGNLVLQGQDQGLVAQGFLAGLVRTYNSLGTTGDVGSAGGWLLGLDQSLSSPPGIAYNTVGSTITRTGSDGSTELFTYDTSRGLYVATNESGAEDTLKVDVTQLTATYTVGGSLDEETYDQNGRLIGLTDGKTGANYTLGYNAQGRLTTVTAGDGEALELGYDAQGRVSTLSTLGIPPGGGTAVIESRVSYGYDTLGRLASVTTDLTPGDTSDNSVFTTAYTYVSDTAGDPQSGLIATLTQGDGTATSYAVSYTYTGDGRIHTVTTGTAADGDAQTLTFSYDLAAHTTTVTDASGQAWVYAYDANASDALTSVTSPAVNGQYQVTSYTYTTDGHLASVTDPSNNGTIYEYDAHGNRVLERDADGNTTAWTYNSADQVLTRTLYQVPDPDGSDPADAGQATGPSTTWYVYADGSDGQADQLRYVIDADGGVSETQYNGKGQVSMTRAYAGTAYDTSALSATTAPTLGDMDTWVGARTAEDLARTTREDYTYDAAGRLTGKTAWDQVDASGAGVADAGEAITTYVYDAQGLLRQQVAARGADRTLQETTSYNYDGMGRLIGSTDAAGNATTYVYTGGGTLTVTQANGLVHTEVRNSAGELVTVTESAVGQTTRTTQYFYDAEGRLRATEAPDGALAYTFYDAAGQVSGTVDALGAVTQYTRDADGHVVETRQYATAVDTTGWLSGGAVTPTDLATLPGLVQSSSDRLTLSLCDAAGLHVADVDAEGYVTTYGYDGVGHRVTTTQYATALGTALGALQTTPDWNVLQSDLTALASADDRTTRTFYDVANRAVATLDAAGYVTTTAYDAAGRVTKTLAYATGLTAAQVAALGNTPSLSAVLADISGSADDQVVRNYYDDRGQLIAQVGADGYLTTTTYDETTHTVTSTRYAGALSAAQRIALTGQESVAALVGEIAAPADAQTRSEQYDADGRLLSSTAVDGTVTTYDLYDAAGNLLHKTETPPSGAGAVRTTSATYDAYGDVLTATDGAGATTTNVYNALGQKVQTTDALGNDTWFFYTADGRLAYTVKGLASGATQNALGEVTAYAYDALGEVTGTTRYAGRLDLTALGLTTSTSLAALGTAVAAIANPVQDATSTYTYTLDGLTASIRDGLGYTTADAYDAFGDLASVQRQLSGAGQTLSAGNSTTTTYTYDARGARSGETADAGGLNRTTRTTYDAFGRVTSRTDGDDHVTTYTYADNPLGRGVSVSATVDGAVRTTQTTYDAYGRVIAQTDALGNVTTSVYSADTRTVTVTTPEGVSVATTRDAYGDTVSVTDGLGHTTGYTYDGDGRLLTTTDALGHVISDTYDADGDLLRTTDADGVATVYTYDAAGRVLTRTVDQGDSTHLNLTTHYSWDGVGRQLSVTDPTGMVTTYTYDADGHATQVVEDAGAGHFNLTTTYAYDGDGNLITQTDADGHVTRYIYDAADEQVYAIDPDGGVTQTWHDADGRVTATRRYATALGSAQLTALGTAPSAAAVAGQVVADPAADQVTYTVYNAGGQPAYTIDPLGHVSEMRYDRDGRVTETLAYANALSGTTLASLQAALQQGTALASLATDVGAGNTEQTAEATLNLYDADGRVRFTVRQDTVNGQLVGMVTEQRYDAAGHIVARVVYGTALPLSTTVSLVDQLSTGSVTQNLADTTDQHLTQYVYDEAGRLRFTLDAAQHGVERQYDGEGRLTDTLTYLNAITVPASLTVASMTAAIGASNDAMSTRFTRTTYDAAGRVFQTTDALTQGVNATYTYDAAGRKTSYTNRDGATTTYVYDTAGRLAEQDSPSVAASSYVGTTGNTLAAATTASIVTRYAYDADGHVTSKTEAFGTAEARITQYAYDGRGHQVSITYPPATAGDPATSAHVTYNALGQAVVNQDVEGHYTYKIYNAAGELAYDIDGNGYVTAYAYDAYGNQTQVTRYATAQSAALLGAGQPLTAAQLSLSATGSRTLTTTYDQLGRKVEVLQGGAGASGVPDTTYAYNAYGALVETSQRVDAGTWARTYDYYDAVGQKTLEVDPLGYVTTWAYDAQGNVTGTEQYAQAISTSGLNTATLPGVPDAGNAATGFDRTTTYTYDAIGRKETEVDTGDYSTLASGIAQGSRTTSWAYDGENRVTAVTVDGAKTTTTYDALGRITSVTQPLRQVLRSSWQTTLTAPDGGNQDLTTAALYESASPVTTFTYDTLGNALSSATATAGAAGGSQVSYSHYDALGRVTSETNADGTAYAHTYNAAGDLLTTAYTLAGNTVKTTYTYDADHQRLSSVTQRYSGGVWVTDAATYVQYDAFGDIVAKGDGVVNAYSTTGYELSYQYDAVGNLLTATDPKSGIQHTYTYDLAGHLLRDSSPALGGATVYTQNTYDLDGRVVAQLTPGSASASGENSAPVTHTFDRWGNVLSTADARGYPTTYLYDSNNQLIEQTEPVVLVTDTSGVRTWATPTKTWYYDVEGHLTGVTDENGYTTTQAWNAAGQRVSTTDALGATTLYAYDGLGRQAAKQTPIRAATSTLPAASHITWQGFNALGQVTTQGDFTLNGSTWAENTQQVYTLDQNGNRLQVLDAIGVLSTDPQAHTSYYTYDSQGRLLSSQTPDQAAAGVADHYTYDVNGNKTGATTADKNSSGQFDTETWTYDAYGRVQDHTDLSGAQYHYAYDPASGLLTEETSTWSQDAGQGSNDQTDPGYVPAADGTGPSSETYTYDADGQVASITQQTGAATTTTTTYQYDANGDVTDEAVHTVDGAGGAVDTDTQSAYDSHNRLSAVTETDASTGILRTAYNYDAAGNRRAVFVQSGYQGGAAVGIGGSGAAPTVVALAAQTVQPGTALNLDVAPSFTDSTGFGLTFSATGLPSWLHMTSSGVLMGTALAPAGSWTVTVTATDANGRSASTPLTVTVPNVAPVFGSGVSNQIAAVGQAFSFTQPGATDANGDPLTYSSMLLGAPGQPDVPLPAWLHFNASTLTWTGTPPAAGQWTVVYWASDGTNTPVSHTFTFQVMQTAPTEYSTVTDQTLYPGRSFAFSFPTSLFTTPDGSTPDQLFAGTWKMVMDPELHKSFEEDDPLPTWMSFYYSNDRVVFIGTPPADTAVGTDIGLYVQGFDAQGEGVKVKFNATVATYVEPAPVYHGTLANQTGVIGGGSLNIPLPSGAFTEADGSALNYTGYVLIPEHTLTYWNSDHTEPLDMDVPAQWVALSSVGLAIDATSGKITGVPTSLNYVVSELTTLYQYAHDTSYQIEVVATNGQAEAAAGTFTLTNSYAPPVLEHAIPTPPAQNPSVGWIQIVPSDTFSDPAGNGLTYSATLSNGAALPSGLSWSASSLDIGTVAAGTYTIKVTATDHASASATFTLTINNVAPTFVGASTNQTVVKGHAFSFTQPGATDANGDAVHYTSMIVGSPDTSLPSWLHFDASTLTWSGDPPSTGTWNVVYFAIDTHGVATSKTFNLTVNNPVAQPPVYNGGIPDPVTLTKAKRTYTIPASAFSSPAGEALTYSATTAVGVSFDPTTRTFTGTIGQNEQYPKITLTVTDTDGRSITHVIDFDIFGTVMNAVPVNGGLGVENEATPTAVPTTAGTQAATQATTQSTSAPNIQAYWFTYDADNRVDVSGGSLMNGQIVVDDRTGSVEKTYDAAGNVVTELTYSGTDTQTFAYDARGEVIRSVLPGGGATPTGATEYRQYDADGRLVADVYTYAPGTYVVVSNADVTNFHMQIGGWLSAATTYYYNADGEVTATYDYGRDTSSPNYWNSIYNGTVNADQEAIPAAPPPLTTAPDGTLGAAEGAGYGVLTLQSDVVHWGPNGEAGYDAEGHALNYQYTRPNVETVAYQVQYLKQDGYLEASTTGTSPQLVKTTDTSYYDAFGRRIAIDTHSANSAIDDSVRAFAYDAEGQILERRDGSVGNNGAGTFSVTANGGYATQHYAYVQGQQIGSVDEAGSIDVLSGVTGFSNTDQGRSDYVAQAGDTMQSIAQAVYGDASLWYVVADANGFESATDAPAAGQSLKLPEVTTNSNTAETFKPYNPHEISGSTTPALPTAPQPPPSAQGCNTLAEIVVIAVVIVASIYTAGAAAEAWGVAGSAEGTFAAGASVMAGSGGLVGAGAAALGAAVGDAAGQLVGDAEGIHQGFSWGEVAGAGIGAGITAGLSGAITDGESIQALAKADTWAADAKLAGVGAAGAVGSYAGDKLVGQPAHFSWANVAAAALSTAATAKLGLPTNTQLSEGESSGHFLDDLGGSLVNGAIDSETARLLGGNAANGRQIAEDAFGNALGNAAIAGIVHENAVSQRQEQSTASLLAADNPSSQANPVAAFLSGPYANDFNDEAGLANYDPTQGPLLAAAGPMDVYDAVHGPVAPIDVTVPSFQTNPSAGALDQLDYDAQWMSYARQMQQQGGAPDIASIQAAQAAYNAADDSDTAANGGQYDPAKVQTLDAALDDMIEANGWSFGPAQQASDIPTLAAITVATQAPTSTLVSDSSHDELALLGLGQALEFNLGATAENEAEGLSLIDVGLRGAAQEGSLSILNRAAAVQQSRMTDISRATSMEEVEAVVSDTSKSGKWISNFSTVSKFVAPATLIADGAVLYSDIKNLPSDQVPLKVAQDTTFFAGEAGAAWAGAEGLALFAFPFATATGLGLPFVEAAALTIGAGAGVFMYNSDTVKGAVNNWVSHLVQGTDALIENPHAIVDDAKNSWNGLKNDTKYAVSYIEYLMSNPKGPYPEQ